LSNDSNEDSEDDSNNNDDGSNEVDEAVREQVKEALGDAAAHSDAEVNIMCCVRSSECNALIWCMSVCPVYMRRLNWHLMMWLHTVMLR